jgi:hypothetical protein
VADIEEAALDRARAKRDQIERELKKRPDFQLYLLTRSLGDRMRMEQLLNQIQSSGYDASWREVSPRPSMKRTLPKSQQFLTERDCPHDVEGYHRRYTDELNRCCFLTNDVVLLVQTEGDIGASRGCFPVNRVPRSGTPRRGLKRRRRCGMAVTKAPGSLIPSCVGGSVYNGNFSAPGWSPAKSVPASECICRCSADLDSFFGHLIDAAIRRKTEYARMKVSAPFDAVLGELGKFRLLRLRRISA